MNVQLKHFREKKVTNNIFVLFENIIKYQKNLKEHYYGRTFVHTFERNLPECYPKF